MSSCASLTFDFPSWQFCGSPADSSFPSAKRAIDGHTASSDRDTLLLDLDELEDEVDGGGGSWLEEAPSSLLDSVAQAETPPAAQSSSSSDGIVAQAHTPPAAQSSSSSGGISKGWPDDVLFAVLSQLDGVPALCTARRVAQQWLEAASCDALWATAWHAHAHFSRRPPRLPCGATAFAAPARRHARFFEYATRCRADHLYRWWDLQLGWDRLEALLAPEQLGVALSAGTRSDIDQARKVASILAARDWELLHRGALLLLIECSEQVARAILIDPHQLPRPDSAADERLLGRLLDTWRSYSRSGHALLSASSEPHPRLPCAPSPRVSRLHFHLLRDP